MSDNSLERRWILIISGTIVLSLFGATIMSMYYYHNFNDYRNMIRKYHPNTYPAPNEPIYMLFFALTFSPVMIWFKYNQLYEHLFKMRHQTDELPPSVKKVFTMMLIPYMLIPLQFFLGYVIHPIFFLLLPIGSILSSLVLILYENQWQVKFNQHITFIM